MWVCVYVYIYIKEKITHTQFFTGLWWKVFRKEKGRGGENWKFLHISLVLVSVCVFMQAKATHVQHFGYAHFCIMKSIPTLHSNTLPIPVLPFAMYYVIPKNQFVCVCVFVWLCFNAYAVFNAKKILPILIV